MPRTRGSAYLSNTDRRSLNTYEGLAPKRRSNIGARRWIELVGGIRNSVSFDVRVGDIDLFAARGFEINRLRSQI